MARVCKKWFPANSRPHHPKEGFYMDDDLKLQLDILLKNIKNDWDFTILVSGGGETRVGKSVLAMQIAAYWAYQIKELYGIKVPLDFEKNFVFDGKDLIKKGNDLGQKYPYAPMIFDEAGADLESKKVMRGSTQDVLDYFRECGQYNLLNILVIPEFFDLPKGIALSRSIFLIDVSYSSNEEGIFERGYFRFFSRRQKKYLYLLGKKELNYHAVKYDLHGRFYNFYPMDEKEYRKLKQEALSKRESKKRNKFQLQRDACWFIIAHEGLSCECGAEVKWTLSKLGQKMEALTGIYTPKQTISDGLRHYKMEEED